MRSQEDVLRSVAKFMADVLGEPWEVRFAVEDGTFKRPYCRVGFAGPRPNPTGPAHTTHLTRPMIAHLYPVIPETAEEAVLIAARVGEQIDRAILIGGGRLAQPGALTETVVEDGGTMTLGSHAYAITALARRGETAAVVATPVVVGALGQQVRLTWGPSIGAVGYRIYRDGLLVGKTTEPTFTDVGRVATSEKPPPVVDTSVVGGPRRIPLYDYEGVPVTSPGVSRFWSDFLRVNDCSIGVSHDPQDERRVTVVCELRVAWSRVGERAYEGTPLARVLASGSSA